MADHGTWLAQTTEETLEPELAICDPHHHLWEYPSSRYLSPTCSKMCRAVTG